MVLFYSFVVLLSGLGFANAQPGEDYNQKILEVVARMPQGGGFSPKKIALDHLSSSVSVWGSDFSAGLNLAPDKATPSFCSGATYLVFLGVIQELMAEKKLQLSAEDLQALLITGQPDGEGVWGRWNANGPGTARLFHELGLGKNFESLSAAKPGDFMKVFWNENIGAKEFGHSVIFLGTRSAPEGEMVRIWSSNIHVGFGEKEVPLVKIKRMLFSRLTNPSALQSVSSLPKRDAYLASLLEKSSSPDEMATMTGEQRRTP